MIFVGVLLIIGVGVYATVGSDFGTAGGSSYYPNPGHTIQQMQPCANSGDILQVNSTGNWSCVSFSSVPSVNLSLSSASLGLSPDSYGKISLGYPNDMKFDGGSDGVFDFVNNYSGSNNPKTQFLVGGNNVLSISSGGVNVAGSISIGGNAVGTRGALVYITNANCDSGGSLTTSSTCYTGSTPSNCGYGTFYNSCSGPACNPAPSLCTNTKVGYLVN